MSLNLWVQDLYVTLVRPHLEYASEIWSPKTATMIKRIEGVQQRVTAYVT